MKFYPLKLILIMLCSIIISCSSDSNEININKPDTNIDSGTDTDTDTDTDTGTDTGNNSNSNTSYETEIMKLINQHRINMGLSELKILDVIKSQTDKHNDYMIIKREISHDNSDDRFEYLQTNANAVGFAENIASGYTSAKAVVDGWIDSKGHRKNIEGNYTHFNLTAKQNQNGYWYYTNIFIKK